MISVNILLFAFLCWWSLFWLLALAAHVAATKNGPDYRKLWLEQSDRADKAIVECSRLRVEIARLNAEIYTNHKISTPIQTP